MAPRQPTADDPRRFSDSDSLLPKADQAFGIQVEKQHLEADGTGTGWFASSFLMANIVIGVGLLNYPSAYRDAGGILPAIIFQSFCMFFIILGEVLIGACSDLSGSDTYQDTVYKHCGRAALLSCNIFITLQNFGSCVMLMVVLADQIDGTFSFSHSYCERWYLSRSVTLPVFSVLLILPTCFWKRIDSCKIGSYIGVGTTAYILFLTIWKYIVLEVDDEVAITYSGHRHWSTVIQVIPAVCFSLEGHIEVVAIYACYNKRSLWDYTKAVLVSNAMCIFVYTITGIFGYLTFGDDITTDVLTSYQSDWMVMMAFAITAIKAVSSYPILFFCIRQVAQEEMLRVKLCQHSSWSESKRDVVTSLLLFIASLLLALVVPNIGSIISLLGGTASLFIFIYPGLCYMHAYKDSSEPWSTCKVILGVSLVTIGVFFGVAAGVLSAFHFVKGLNNPDHHLCIDPDDMHHL